VRPLREPIFALKLFQSVAERAPVVVDDARAREIPDPEIERPLVAPERKLTLLLNVAQSVDDRSPDAVREAYGILKV
jgi:hypothetical protein